MAFYFCSWVEQVFVANHTSMIDFIILEQMTAFAVIMQKHPGWVGKCLNANIHTWYIFIQLIWYNILINDFWLLCLVVSLKVLPNILEWYLSINFHQDFVHVFNRPSGDTKIYITWTKCPCIVTVPKMLQLVGTWNLMLVWSIFWALIEILFCLFLFFIFSVCKYVVILSLG